MTVGRQGSALPILTMPVRSLVRATVRKSPAITRSLVHLCSPQPWAPGSTATHAPARSSASFKYGVLVIQSYNRFLDGSRRPPYFTREFFHQRLDKPPAGALAPTDVAAAALPYRMAADRPMTAPRPRDAVDLGPLLGRWHNTNPNTKGIASVVLERAADAYEIGATGVSCDEDWGRVPAIPHAAHISGREPAGFLACFDFGFSEVLFSANEAKGLLIIASFTTFRDDSGRSSYFTRESFYREDGRTDTP